MIDTDCAIQSIDYPHEGPLHPQNIVRCHAVGILGTYLNWWTSHLQTFEDISCYTFHHPRIVAFSLSMPYGPCTKQHVIVSYASGGVTGSGISAETAASIFCGAQSFNASIRIIRMCVWGRPLFGTQFFAQNLADDRSKCFAQ